MVIDLDKIEVKETSGKTYLKDDGQYEVTVVDYAKGTADNTGTPYIKFECKTDKDEYISLSLYLTDKAFWKFKKFLTALGHPGTGNIDVYEAANQCKGRRLVVDCAHRETINPITMQKEVGKYLEVVNFFKC